MKTTLSFKNPFFNPITPDEIINNITITSK